MSALSYHYPVKPFDRQHPIRGSFGDPRTLTSETFGDTSAADPGSFTFHNGVDIVAATGTQVYPVVSGVVRVLSGDAIVVRTSDGRAFQYFHISPRVVTGSRVVAYRTVLGTVRPRFRHVHMSEIDGFQVHNPADPGHLEPYRDHTLPSVIELRFTDEHGAALDPGRLHGRVLIAAKAEDSPPVPVPGEWFGHPVAPALVSWRITAKGVTLKPETVVVDFRKTEPPNRDFWHVYASGTYQNFPVFAHTYFFRYAGQYMFNLTGAAALDTRRYPNGRLGVTVDVADVCGNRSSFSETVSIAN